MTHTKPAPLRLAILLAATTLVATGCGSSAGQQTSAQVNTGSAAKIDDSGEDPNPPNEPIHVDIPLRDLAIRLPGPFVGPFDGTVETLGHCEEDMPDDVEDRYINFIDYVFSGLLGWHEVKSVDLSGATLEPDAYQTADGAGAKIELVDLGYPRQPDYPTQDWRYGGETLAAIADELARGRQVHIASENDGKAVPVSIDDDGYIRFIENCAIHKARLIDDFLKDLTEFRGVEVTGLELLSAVQEAGSYQPIATARLEMRAGNRPLSWEELDPMDRRISLDETPEHVLDGLVSVELAMTIPDAWAREAYVLCPRQKLGWARLCAAGGAAVDGVLVFDMLVNETEPIEIWLMNSNGTSPVGPIAIIEAGDVHADKVINASLSTALSMADAYKAPNDAVDVVLVDE